MADAPVSELKQHSKWARKVITTLWKFQIENFKEDTVKRWAFGVHPAAPDYQEFNQGVHELRYEGLVLLDPRGMVALSDKGLGFCQANKSELENNSDYWNQFSPI